MQSCEVTELHFQFPSNPTQFPSYLGLTNKTTSGYNQFNRFYNHLYITPQAQEFNPQLTCLSSISTSDEADEQHLNIINERKQRRMISNRESARRSRMRKKKYLHELCSLVVWLRNENQQLMDKLNLATDDRNQVLKENDQLKEETTELHQIITEMQLNSHFLSLEEIIDDPCNDFLGTK